MRHARTQVGLRRRAAVSATLSGGGLRLSFVPDAEQRTWRCLSRSKHQKRRRRVQIQNQIEALLEESQIKLSSVITDLLGLPDIAS
jgi:hypothetical protein